MAAIITTLADHSYAYPDAIILHHQAQTTVAGNTTQTEEQLELLREISARLVGEVAKKIGLTEEEFVEQMYEAKSTGDWLLFGDQAVEKGWVDNIVTQIRETNMRTKPKSKKSSSSFFDGMPQVSPSGQASTSVVDRYEVKLEERVDDDGKRFVRLPRLMPFDAWYLYNPDSYYRAK